MERLQQIILTCLFCLVAGATLAQEQSSETPQELATEFEAGRLQGLIETLDDPERRAIFLDRLRTLAAIQEAEQREAETPGEGNLADALMGSATRGIDALSTRMESAIGHLANAPMLLQSAYDTFMDPDSRTALTEISAKVVGVFLVSLLGAALIRRLLQRAWQSVQRKSAKNPFSQILLMLASLILRLIPLAGMLAIAWVVLPMLDPRPVTRTVLLSLVYAHVIAQAIMIAANVVLAVDNPTMRPYKLPDETAAYCYIWIRRITVLTVYGYFITQALLLMGMEPTAHKLLVDLIGLFVLLLFIALVMQSRVAGAEFIRGGPQANAFTTQLRGTIAALWHLLAIVYMIGVYVVWATELDGGFMFLVWRTVLTLLILGLARLAMTGAEQALNRLFHFPARLREQYPGLEERADRYRPAVTSILKAIVILIGAAAILQAWGFNTAGFIATDTGRQLLSGSLRILFIIGFSFLLWEIISALIERQLQAKASSNRRILTLLPLLKNVVRMVIAAVGVMIVLSELGMNIGPLIASAGVIGLAVGFGAQTLVRDLISGIFVILEDIVSVGDWVEIGPHMGMVEAMSIRTMKLRDVSGNLRVIPFGEVTTVHKVAADYSYALIIIGVAYRENTDEVLDVLTEVSEEMRQHEDWKNIILEPMEVQGVNDLANSSVDLRVRFKCVPMNQWALRREFLRRAKLAFDEKGIEIPFPHQTIYFGEDKDGSAPPARIDLRKPAEE